MRYENAKVGEGSTLDFFNDDYYIPLTESNLPPEVKEARDTRTQARYENTLDRLHARFRESNNTNNIAETIPKKFNTVREMPTQKREPIDRSKTFRDPLSREKNSQRTQRTTSTPESMIQNWVLKSQKRTSLPSESDIQKLCRGKNRNSTDSGVSVRTCNSIPEISSQAKEHDYNDILQDLDNHLYEDIEKYQNENGEVVEDFLTKMENGNDINNNAAIKRILDMSTKRRPSQAKYFTSAECQTDISNYQSAKKKVTSVQTQTDISFSNNLFTVNTDNYLDNI